MTNRTRTHLFGALASVAFLLAACSSTPASTPSPTSAPQPTAAVQDEQPASLVTTSEAATVAPQTTSEPTAEAQPAEAAQPTGLATASETVQAASAITKLNLNIATGEQFLTVPNVGNRMVREFEEYRPYVSIQQFRREIGKYVDQAQVAEYEKYVFVPVSPNESDAETLQQLPGVDAAIAEQLIAARPYTDRAAFLDKLSQLISAEQFVVAETYVEAE